MRTVTQLSNLNNTMLHGEVSQDGLIPASVTENAHQKMLAAGGNVKMSYTQYPLNHLQNYMQAVAQSKGIFDSYVNASN